MATIKLDTGAASITIQAPKFPYIPGEDQPVIVNRTMNGGAKIADMGDGTDFEDPQLHFRQQSDADFVAMRDYIQDTLSMSKTAFTYTDPFGTNHTNMHYLDGLREFEQINGKWNGIIQLFKDVSA